MANKIAGICGIILAALVVVVVLRASCAADSIINLAIPGSSVPTIPSGFWLTEVKPKPLGTIDKPEDVEVGTIITAGAQVSDDTMVISYYEPSTNQLSYFSYDLPYHGPWYLKPDGQGQFIMMKRWTGWEFNGTLGASTGGYAGTLEFVYFNDLFGIRGFNPHIAASAMTPYEDPFSEVTAGVGLNFDLFPEHTNLRLGIHYGTDFKGDHGLFALLTSEIFSFD
ncbi:MAG: hypothetical protein WC455_09630 [Dehalococcoidia bacterium]|jgi:hypothetical protein